MISKQPYQSYDFHETLHLRVWTLKISYFWAGPLHLKSFANIWVLGVGMYRLWRSPATWCRGGWGDWSSYNHWKELFCLQDFFKRKRWHICVISRWAAAFQVLLGWCMQNYASAHASLSCRIEYNIQPCGQNLEYTVRPHHPKEWADLREQKLGDIKYCMIVKRMYTHLGSVPMETPAKGETSP